MSEMKSSADDAARTSCRLGNEGNAHIVIVCTHGWVSPLCASGSVLLNN